MIGKTFREICEEDDARGASVLREEGTSYGRDIQNRVLLSFSGIKV